MTATAIAMTANQPIVVTPFMMGMAVATLLALAIGLGILFGQMIDDADEMKELKKRLGLDK